jgi:hypothetical protein
VARTSSVKAAIASAVWAAAWPMNIDLPYSDSAAYETWQIG